MYEETKSSIDWKGLFLKAIIAVLIVLIAVKGYTTLKGNNNKTNEPSSTATAESKSSATFTANIEKLKNAGEKYFNKNEDKLPKTEGTTTMVTLNELINGGFVTELTDEEGKSCDVESSYVTAMFEGKQTKLKTNLVCGEASSYSLVYMGENNTETTKKEESKNTATTVTSTNTNTKKASSSSSSSSNTSSSTSNKTSSSSTTCSNSSCTPEISVSANASTNQVVTINTGSSNASTVTPVNYYTVKFNSNGGNISYGKQTVKENETAKYPGTNAKNSCSFKGWYYNGVKFDFSTPITKDIELDAKYNCYYDDYVDYEDYEDYEDRYNKYDRDNDGYVELDEPTTVYSMAWKEYGTDTVRVSHTLKLPEELDNSYIKKVRIKNITRGGAINTTDLVNKYYMYHAQTFIYQPNGYETYISRKSALSTILKDDVTLYYSTSFKTLNDARNNGFDVTWNARDVYKQCSMPYIVGDSTVCNYGIYYYVTWEYQLY